MKTIRWEVAWRDRPDSIIKKKIVLSCKLAEEMDMASQEFNWWRVDLQDMYDVKAVNIMNGQGEVERPVTDSTY